MRELPKHFLPLLVVIIAASLFVAAGLVGGPDNARDVAAIQSLAAERSTQLALTRRAIVITHVGGAPGLVAILLIAIASLAIARRWRDAMSLAGIVLGGRILVEIFKIFINRPRPSFGPFPVEVVSLSFPSGHAANSMITFLAIALIAAPARMRVAAIVGAILASGVIGATRPLLGVHWPTDVIGGWAFGIGWVVALVALGRRWRGAAE